MILTVFTPTFNRAHTLERLYGSLCRQSCKDFEWLVIDDGSTDGTRQLVEAFSADRIIAIRYIYKENGGFAVRWMDQRESLSNTLWKQG